VDLGAGVVRLHTSTGDGEPVNNESAERARRLEVTLFGPAAASVLRALSERYDLTTSTSPCGTDTLIAIADIDQSGERAVVTLLWDTGHQVRSLLRSEP
jgi:hypothetical protein